MTPRTIIVRIDVYSSSEHMVDLVVDKPEVTEDDIPLLMSDLSTCFPGTVPKLVLVEGERYRPGHVIRRRGMGSPRR